MNEIKPQWEEEFDKSNIENGFPPHPPWMKAFISKQISEARERVIEDIRKIAKNIPNELDNKTLKRPLDPLWEYVSNHSLRSDMPEPFWTQRPTP